MSYPCIGTNYMHSVVFCAMVTYMRSFVDAENLFLPFVSGNINTLNLTQCIIHMPKE